MKTAMTKVEAQARAKKLFGKPARNASPPDPEDTTEIIYFVGKANQEGRICVVYGKGANWEEAVGEAEIAVAGNCGDKDRVVFLKHSC
jgi:high-affinity K+ transport system ATPase subunit B